MLGTLYRRSPLWPLVGRDLHASVAGARRNSRFVLGLLLCAPMVSAADPIAADRPGAADPAFVVGRGTAQIETGATFAHESDGADTDTWTLPEPLLRIGILDRAELRIAADGFISQHTDGEGTENVGSDLEVATKIRLLEQVGWRPATSLLAGLRFPTGGDAVTSDGYDPIAKLIASWEIGERFSVDANLGFGGPTQSPDDSDRVFETFAAASMGVALGERVGSFFEYFATLRGSGRDDEHAVDAGLTYLATDDVQLDVSAGAGLNRAAPDVFVGIGVAWRFHEP